jgi:hypothetical protein
MKNALSLLLTAGLACGSAGAVFAGVSFPVIIDFSDSPTGTDAPLDWRHGPPAGTKSIGMPWSVAETPDWGNVYQFSGPGQFDGNGRAYATFPVDDLPFGDGANWRFSVDFRLVDFLMDGPMDSFRMGLGVLGQNTLFGSASAGGFGGNDFYLIDWGFTLPEMVQQLDAVSMTYRFIEFGALGAVDIGFYSRHVEAGFFNTKDTFRMIVEGRFSGTDLNLASWVENITQGAATDSVTAVAPNPLPGRHFGFRLQSGAGVTTVSPPSPNALGELTIHFDNVRLTDVDYTDPDPEPDPFWNAFADAGDGWKTGWLGLLKPSEGAWAYQSGMGWIHSVSSVSDSVWIHPLEHPSLGWIWTTDALFPFVWSSGLGWGYLLDSGVGDPQFLAVESGT